MPIPASAMLALYHMDKEVFFIYSHYFCLLFSFASVQTQDKKNVCVAFTKL